ncbi:hypothetical protein GCM10023238_35270 [Streptomyces heliomycini]
MTASKNFRVAATAVDKVGHGTHVASIAARTGARSKARTRCVAPGAKDPQRKVLDDCRLR